MKIEIRPPSNTLIITNVSDEVLNEPQEFIKFLSQDHKYCIQLISLIKFGRIILVCESKDIAIEVKNRINKSSQWCHFKISFSIRDNDYVTSHPTLCPNQDHDEIEDIVNSLNLTSDDATIDYLELPLDLGSRRFLISPPRSPPPDWDHWDRVEEGPNEKPIYSSEDISHLLWQKLGGMDSSIVRKYQHEDENGHGHAHVHVHDQVDEESSIQKDDEEVDIKIKPEVLFEGLQEGVPAIIIDPAKLLPRKNKSGSSVIPKTAIPPREFE